MASPSAAALLGRGAQNLLQFLRLVGQLKRVPRTGWVYRNVQSPESVSDHMYRMAIMALVTKDEHLNKDRCIRLALVHDMAECIVGDIAPADNIPKEEKHRREEEAMKQLTQLLPEDLRKELDGLWEGCCNKLPEIWMALNNRNVLFHSSGVWKSKIKVLAGLCSEGSRRGSFLTSAWLLIGAASSFWHPLPYRHITPM
uniref:5'-deoxynucleotidase HDDC2 isoform X3 n=1 Tax=Panthera onca TaxID=9690 RepID=UPI002953814D|nr:5'-deoxynucleotidase HDDC2 isoform X3 [Panthera onca]